jgi:hypothetical protein
VSDIDVTIPGSVESVSGAASWLEGLRDNFSDANLLFTNNSTQANSALVGELGSAVTAFSDDLSKACNDAYDRAKKAADTIRSFANQLSWRKDDMNDHLETARGYDLVVEGNIIRYPEAVSDPGDLPKGCTKAEQEEWHAADEAYDAYRRKVKHFEKVRGKVNGTFEELNDWIDENLATTESEVLQNTRLTGTKALLATALDKGYGKVVKHKYAAAAEELRGAAEQAAIRAAQDASANPQVHARKARPSDKAIDRKRGKGESGKLEKKAISKEKFGKNAAKLGGGAITIGFAVYDLVRGEPPSETILTATTGTIAAAAAGSGGILVAPAVSTGTSYAYETWVSQETREKIDEGLVDSKNWVFDNLGDACSSAEEKIEDFTDLIADGWKMGTR